MKIKLNENTVDDSLDVVLNELQISKLGDFAGTVGKQNIQSHFLNQVDSKGRKWEPISELTKKVLRKHGGDIPLRDEGRLLGSTSKRRTSKGAVIELSRGLTDKGQNIAEILNKGGLLWSRLLGRNVKVPGREFAYIDKDGKEQIQALPKIIAKKAKK